MKDQQQINAGQMSSLFFIFLSGATIINIPGPLIGFAKNGAWISLLLSLIAGMGLLACVLFLYRKFPQLTLIEYSQQLVGKWMTFIIAIPFLIQILQMESGIVLDIGLFMNSSMMRQTPLYIFVLLSFLVIALEVNLYERFLRHNLVPLTEQIQVLAFVRRQEERGHTYLDCQDDATGQESLHYSSSSF